MTIDMTKTYTCNGKPFRLLCTDGPGPFPVVGIADDGVRIFRADGTSPHGEQFRLVEVREKRRLTGWVNVYKSHVDQFHTEHAAKDSTYVGILARIPLSQYEYEVGSGLEERE